MPELRPLTLADVDAVHALSSTCFSDLDRRMGRPGPPAPPNAIWYASRTSHLIATDPGGCIGADVDGVLAGVAMAIVREGLWGLSLFLVHPDHQGTGIGRDLLRAALDHGSDLRGRIILSSDDPRAMRAYARSGHRLIPSFDIEGPVKVRPERPDGVREGRAGDDDALVDAAGHAVRGAGYSGDIGAYLAVGNGFLVHEGGGFAVLRSGSPALLAAQDEDIAADLLRGCLHAATAEVSVQFVTHANQWAIDVSLDAGLVLKPAGPVCVSGEVGPLAPFLPSGAFL